MRPILPDGVTVAQQTLNLFVMVQIHVGQPFYDFNFHWPRKTRFTSAFSAFTSTIKSPPRWAMGFLTP